MKKLVLPAACVLFALVAPGSTTVAASSPASAAISYGANKAASGTFINDGVSLYYEVYGAGPPLLLVHGNGGSIGWLAAQIEFFRKTHRVIVMDSRDQGRSGDSTGPLTYEKMTDDLAALLDHLKTGPVDIVGWSDGGIEALMMGLRHPDKVRKLVAMGANINPEGNYPETDKLVNEMLAAIPPEVRNTPAGRREVKVASLMLTEPHIELALLKTIAAPTLILSGDHDLIRLQHTVTMYEALPNAQLAVLPNSTHLVPYDSPGLFNATVARFLNTPFKKKDRISDTMASFERLVASLPN